LAIRITHGWHEDQRNLGASRANCAPRSIQFADRARRTSRRRLEAREAVAIALDRPGALKQPDERLVAAAARRVAAFLGLDARDVRR
jgi:hypothetical protein